LCCDLAGCAKREHVDRDPETDRQTGKKGLIREFKGANAWSEPLARLSVGGLKFQNRPRPGPGPFKFSVTE
jgi:hypothetical protein